MPDFPTIDDKPLLEEGSVLAPRFDAKGLVTAVVQDSKSLEILMLAHMNALSLEKTLETGQSHFWSRSRQELWHKGATSGNVQHVEELLIDCDQDAIILKVRVEGHSACHTGRRSCFYRVAETGENRTVLKFVDDSSVC